MCDFMASWSCVNYGSSNFASPPSSSSSSSLSQGKDPTKANIFVLEKTSS